MDDLVDHVRGARVFSSLDLADGYWKAPVHVNDREKIRFATPGGLFQFRQVPFGFCNTRTTFQRLMESVLGFSKWSMCLVYMDDVLTFRRFFYEHIKNAGSTAC